MRISETVAWSNCYDGAWDWETPESVRHPAKMAWGLTFQVLRHMANTGLLRPGDTVVDFMSGTGRTGSAAVALGYPTVTVELEPAWHRIQTGFFCDPAAGQPCAAAGCLGAHHVEGMRERAARLLGQPVDWLTILGDARDLPNLHQWSGGRPAAVFSPPYGSDTVHGRGTFDTAKFANPAKVGRTSFAFHSAYGDAPGQIGHMPEGRAGLVSPPYMEGQTGGGVARDGYTGKHERDPRPMADRMGYSADRLAGVVSPPYPTGGHHASQVESVGGLADEKGAGGYGDTPGQIGHMGGAINVTGQRGFRSRQNPNGSIAANLRAGVVSPPYDNRLADNDTRASMDPEGKHARPATAYGASEGQLGNARGTTYHEAMLEVYAAAREVCSVLAVVTKNPTRQGRIVPLHRQTARMLRATGWRLVDYHRAMLFDVERQADMFGNVISSPRGRLSFFKRMAYQRGQPVAQWEDILFAVAA